MTLSIVSVFTVGSDVTFEQIYVRGVSEIHVHASGDRFTQSLVNVLNAEISKAVKST